MPRLCCDRHAGLVLLVALMSGCQGSAAPNPIKDPVSTHRVIDGDTLDVVDAAGNRERVRILGIDAPELGRDGRQAECYASEAKSRVSVLLRRRPVTLTVDPGQPTHDRYDRVLAYVTVDGRDLGEQLLSEGFVRQYHRENQPPPARDASYRRAEQQARMAVRGMWGRCV